MYDHLQPAASFSVTLNLRTRPVLKPVSFLKYIFALHVIGVWVSKKTHLYDR